MKIYKLSFSRADQEYSQQHVSYWPFEANAIQHPSRLLAGYSCTKAVQVNNNTIVYHWEKENSFKWLAEVETLTTEDMGLIC